MFFLWMYNIVMDFYRLMFFFCEYLLSWVIKYIDNNYSPNYHYLKIESHQLESSKFPIGSMGLVYLPTFSWFLMINVGKYTSPMDPMALIPTKRWHVLSSKLRTKTEVWHPAVENPSHPRSLGARWSVDLLPPGGACVGFNLQPSKLGD